MLVLTRRKNESIVINHVVTVTVVEIRGDKVRLGIDAPRDVEVHRQEVYDAINRERSSSGESGSGPTPPEAERPHPPLM